MAKRYFDETYLDSLKPKKKGRYEVGEHDVSLQVSDGTDRAVQDFTVTVEEVDEPAPSPPPSGGSGGGSFGSWSLFALLTGAATARRRRHAM